MWTESASSCREGVRTRPDGKKPIDEAKKILMFDPSVRMLLLPYPSGASATTSASSWSDHLDRQPANKHQRNLQDDNAKLRRQLAMVKGNDKGVGKGKQQSFRGPKMPAVLRGKSIKTGAGEPICFNFN